MRMLNPPHPGAFVKTEVIDPLDLTVAAAAVVLGDRGDCRCHPPVARLTPGTERADTLTFRSSRDVATRQCDENDQQRGVLQRGVLRRFGRCRDGGLGGGSLR